LDMRMGRGTVRYGGEKRISAGNEGAIGVNCGDLRRGGGAATFIQEELGAASQKTEGRGAIWSGPSEPYGMA
jgi:hypothetical protein